MNKVNRAPKFIMYYLFPVDSVLRPKQVTPHTVDRKKLCLPKDDNVLQRMLHLFHPLPSKTIVRDLKQMGLNGLACVGLDGTCLSLAEIRSLRYVELIEACQKAGLMFIHGFPFADTYGNELSQRYPHIKQRTYDGKHPYVGWDENNGHPTLDYGSDEFIAFCKESVDALDELGVRVIDYAEPDHFPWLDNGYGESLAAAWKQAKGNDLPHPTTLEHRQFMEDRNIKGIREIGRYARRKGMADHLTASPLMHFPALICQNYGKYSRMTATELSTTYHFSFGYGVVEMMRDKMDMAVPTARPDGVGCIESKSMRSWQERHAVYIGCGQGVPLERLDEILNTAVLLHQMDLFFWDYGNFRNQSMYGHNRFDEPCNKYREFQRRVRTTIDTYGRLPKAYREATPTPDALVYYAKNTDYRRAINKEADKLPGCYSAYALAFKLQGSDIPFLFAYDEYPDILHGDARKVPMMIIDGNQELSSAFADATVNWFGKGKIIFLSGTLSGAGKNLAGQLAAQSPGNLAMDPIVLDGFRTGDYCHTQSALDIGGWRVFAKWADKGLAYIMGTAATGLLIYSPVSACLLYQSDLRQICQKALTVAGHRPETIQGSMPREIMRYRNGARLFLAIKNHSAAIEPIVVTLPWKPTDCYPRKDERALSHNANGYKLDLNFRPNEVRIIEFEHTAGMRN
ncbi:MAG: hypothetical protein PHW60_03850 [Kiritimatiellae bacterium]|nr:hypothetical protein [Kiritimatiellia bacterium]